MKLIELDFKAATNKEAALDIFQKAFQFEIVPKNLDSLDDMLSTLDTESKVFKEAKGNIKIKVVNLENNTHVTTELKANLLKIIESTL